MDVKLYCHWRFRFYLCVLPWQIEMTNEDKHRLCLQAQQQIGFYQARIIKAFNRKVTERIFKKGGLILAVRRPVIMIHKIKSKFQSKWEPYIVETIYSNGAYNLTNPNSDTLMMPINWKFLKKYYAWSCSSFSLLKIKLILHLDRSFTLINQMY